MARKKTANMNTGGKNRPIETYEHKDKERLNNPPVGLVTPETDPDAGKKKTYAYDPHLDPQLVWSGKVEHTSFEVPTVSLHVHERIDPRSIIEAVRRAPDPAAATQLSLFQTPLENPPLRQAIEFYRHAHGWSNRLVAGDSLLVMNSLLEKEGLAGKVQMIYIDPPYGIRYGSNFQPFVNKRDVKDGKDEDLTAEPEQIRAFRDTWELGIHSYLAYLRDRLLLARELLTESGSLFVQISDENVHHVRELIDDVFTSKNFVALIPFGKTAGAGAKVIGSEFDYLIWYARDIAKLKSRPLYLPKAPDSFKSYKYAVSEDASEVRYATSEEREYPSKLPKGWKLAQLSFAVSQDPSKPVERIYRFNGIEYDCGENRHWKTKNPEGLSRLANAKRLIGLASQLNYIRYYDDFPATPLTNNWSDTGSAGFSSSDPKVYVVQTDTLAIQRCLLMTTDPGDLAFDPTCVRKGTRVYTPSTPSPTLPVNGEGASLPASEGWASLPPCEEMAILPANEERASPLASEAKTSLPPFTGGLEGGLTPIELLHPGDWVLGHDGHPHRVLRLIRKPYCGPMVGICHSLNPQTLWLTADHPVLCKSRPRTLGGQRDWNASPITHLEHRKQLRQEATLAERKLWSALRNDLSGISLSIRNHVQISLESPEGAQWIQAGALQPGDLVFCGPALQSVEVQSVESVYAEEQVYDLEIEGAHSFLTEVCAVHNCGSGTTAFVAEQWGRRWITCDTSRVALTLARQRLMTAVFDYYELAHPGEGVGSGFKYKTVPHVTLKSIANNEPPATETLYDQPLVDRKRTRVSGPFTVEAVPAPAVKSVEEALTPTLSQREREFGADASIARSGETLRQSEWRDELLRTGIRGKAGQHIRFARLEPLPGCRWLHADGETRPSAEGADSVREDAPAYSPQRIVVSFGPEHAPLEQRQVAHAIEEAQTLVPKPKLIVFAAFQFDPEAAKDIDETNWPGVTLLKAQMNADLLTDDLKKKRASNESFWLIGQPDVALRQIQRGEHKGKWEVELYGFDYYNTKTGNIESGSNDKIAIWLLDPDYDGRSLFPRQVFFPMAGDGEGWARLAKNLKAEIDEDLIEAYRGAVSLPFELGSHHRVAVKIVDDRGIESLKVLEVLE